MPFVNVVQPEKKFRDDPVTPVYRHWLCHQEGCDGEMICTGQGLTQIQTNWQHRCNKCHYEEWIGGNYPKIVYI